MSGDQLFDYGDQQLIGSDDQLVESDDQPTGSDDQLTGSSDQWTVTAGGGIKARCGVVSSWNLDVFSPPHLIKEKH